MAQESAGARVGESKQSDGGWHRRQTQEEERAERVGVVRVGDEGEAQAEAHCEQGARFGSARAAHEGHGPSAYHHETDPEQGREEVEEIRHAEGAHLESQPKDIASPAERVRDRTADVICPHIRVDLAPPADRVAVYCDHPPPLCAPTLRRYPVAASDRHDDAVLQYEESREGSFDSGERIR